MAKKAINPTDKLAKVYLDGRVMTTSAVTALALQIDGIMTTTAASIIGLYNTCTTDDPEWDGAFINLGAAKSSGAEQDVWTVTLTCLQHGSQDQSYIQVSDDPDGGGQWVAYVGDQTIPLTGEYEITLNAAIDGRTTDLNGRTISSTETAQFASIIYVKDDTPEPEPTEEDYCYVDRIKKFITRMEGKKISEQ